MLDISSSNCGRRTVKGKRHLAAQAASVLGAEKGLVLLPDFGSGGSSEPWKISHKLNVLVCILKPGVRLQRFRQAARIWRVGHVLPSRGRAETSVGSGSIDMPASPLHKIRYKKIVYLKEAEKLLPKKMKCSSPSAAWNFHLHGLHLRGRFPG